MVRTVKHTFELDMEFPDDWGDYQIYFYLNDSSWCVDNILDKLYKVIEENGCLCSIYEGRLKAPKEKTCGICGAVESDWRVD